MSFNKMCRINFRLLKRAIKYWWQRRTRGWDDSETWSLDGPIAKFVYPRLVRFKELNNGYPAHLTIESWNKILDEMIFAFKTLAEDKDGSREWAEDESLRKRVNNGIAQFSVYFFDLWW